MTSVAVIGAGAWGTVLANILAKNGHDVTLWCYQQRIADNICEGRHHRLPGIELSATIRATTTMADCYAHDLVILGLSSAQLVMHQDMIQWAKIQCPILYIAKGVIEPKWFISEWLSERFSGDIGVISGPNLAIEVAAQKPAASVVAATSAHVATMAQQLLSNSFFRVYTSNDMLGVQCGGIFKNVLAIAAGCIDGLQLGVNAKSALITRGLVEMQQLFQFFGAKNETLMGLSGIGDLIATCVSPTSRNWQLGHDLVTAPNDTPMISKQRGETEGARTIELIEPVILSEGFDLPIMMAVSKLIKRQWDTPEDIIKDLMERGLKSEYSH